MKKIIAVFALCGALSACSNDREDTRNTGGNAGDQRGDVSTAGDVPNGGNTGSDDTRAQRLRQALAADDALSEMAKHVKIGSSDGTITLRGPVNTAQEKADIGAKAAAIAGANHVHNELEVITE